MALNINITINGKISYNDQYASISFEDDADYWYLWDALIQKVKSETGQLVDLYDDAIFAGNNLIKLRDAIYTELGKLEKINLYKWEVLTGTQTHPVTKDVYKILYKKDIENKLQKFLFLVETAIQKSEKVICIGD